MVATGQNSKLKISHSKLTAGIALLLLALAGIIQAGEKQPSLNENSALGINLGGVTYYSTEIVFVDLFKHSQTWKSQAAGKSYGQGGPLDLTEDGWVRLLAGNGQFADSIVLSNINGRYPGGVYTCIYGGNGVIKFAHGISMVDEQPPGLELRSSPSRICSPCGL